MDVTGDGSGGEKNLQSSFSPNRLSESKDEDEGDDHLARRWACHAARHLLNIYKHTTVDKS
jgi:hypothetical protein